MAKKAAPKPRAKVKHKAKAKTPISKAAKVGRPSVYKAEYAKQAYKLCLLGATDKKMADFFEVDERTINRWKESQVEFCQSIKKGKDLADAEIASSLFHRAKGYSCKDTKFATHEGKITDAKEFTKNYPPDTTAQIFWLKNRQKENWRDKQDMEVSGQLDVRDVSKEDRQAQLTALLEKAMGNASA